MTSIHSSSLATSKQLAAALRWGMPDAAWERLTQRVAPLRGVGRTTKLKSGTDDARPGHASAEHWLSNPGMPLTSREAAAELLAWATLAAATDHALETNVRAGIFQRLAAWLDAGTGDATFDPVTDLWWNVELPLLRSLLERAVRNAGQPDEADPANLADPVNPVDPANLAARADEAAAAALERSWPTWMDAEGVPHAAVLDDLWLLLASWTRCLAHRERLSREPWSDNLSEQYDRFVQQLCRLTRADGAALFAERNASQPSSDLLAAAFARAPHEETRITARFAGLLGSASKASGNAAGRGKAAAAAAAVELDLHGVPLLPCYAEGTGLAVTRSDWSATALQVAVAFDGHQSLCSVAAGRQTWISGEWASRLAINDRTLSVTAPWREVLWFSDDEVDYWEWELYFEDDWRVQRQMLMYRGAKWCLLADAVLGEQSASIDYESSWQIAATATFQPASDSHEGRLESRQARAVVLPLALPEWRAEASPGTLGAQDGRLALRLRREGQAVYAPLFVMADRQLGRQPFTWRRLTVAESLKIVTLDMAAGYRVQFGRKQWTFYRALGAEANRTLLGQNVSSNFLACEFQADGLARPLVRIEASNGGRIGPDAAPRADHL